MPGTNGTERYQTLGSNVIPLHYSLRITPNLDTFLYLCNESIDVTVRRPTKQISLNAADLRIKSAEIESDSHVQRVTVISNKDQTITLKFRKSVVGKSQIKIDFEGSNNSALYGFYRSSYSYKGSNKHILTTQFEAANARNAFPCFDEPAFKAIFSVALVVDKGLECISNMPISRETDIGGGKMEVVFFDTPRMSSYLLYLGVGNYDHATGNVGGLKVRVVTTRGNGKLAFLSLEYAKRFIKFFEAYFGIKYPLPKLDLIAIPDFSAGAMENWGAITFRETEILADKNSSLAVLQRIAEVIAHELAHQWFGDLVTMKWWDDLWLNESFATFMSYKAMDGVFPEWKMKVEYTQQVIATAFAADQLKSTHPISVNVGSPADVDQIFDEISYEKGGTVLNMIEDYVGKEIFREGLHRYLKKHAYSNATKYDLWRAIDEVAKSRHKDVMVYGVASFWINKPGYPSIDVKRGRHGVTLRQSRYFLLNGEHDNTVWPIPVNYLVSGKRHRVIINKRSSSINVGKGKWIKLNAGQAGLYRVSYDREDAERLGELILSNSLGSVDSWGVEHDIFAMSRSGRVHADDYLEFAEKYCLNGGYPLNADVLGSIAWIYERLYEEGNVRSKELLIMHANEILGKLGWSRKPRESTFDTLLRPAAILRSGLAGYEPTLDKAVRMFHDHMKNKAIIDPNIRGAVYYLAAWSEGEKIFDLLRSRYLKESLPEEKIRLLKSLAFFSDSRLMRRAFDFSLSKDVRIQDSYILPAIGASNPFGRAILLEWTKKNWDTLLKRYASGTHMLGRYIDNLGALRTRRDLAEVKRFFRAKKNFREDLRNSLNNTLEQIESNIRFVDANR